MTTENTVLQVLGWTLVHSTWIWILMFLVVWATVRLVGLSIKWKYRFALFTLIFGITFCLLIGLGKAGNLMGPPLNTYEIPDVDRQVLDTTHLALPINQITTIHSGRRQERLEKWFPAITIAWALGVMFFSLHFVVRYYQLRVLKINGVRPVEKKWLDKLQVLQAGFQLSQKISLMESFLAHGPLTFGWLKPVILIPVGLFNQLDEKQAEMVLLHELGHIKRYDFFVNLVQQTIEVLFFFHPAVYRINRIIQEYRECLCDELAINTGIDKLQYVETLVKVQHYFITSKIQLTMNATQKGSGFIERMHRILIPEKVTESRVMRLILPTLGFTFLISAMAILTAFVDSQSFTVSIAAEKMNVLYIGVDNPLTVAVAGIPQNKIKVASEDLILEDKGNGYYIAKPMKPGIATIKVESDLFEPHVKTFRVKRIPSPIAGLPGRKIGGPIKAEEFRTFRNLDTYLDGFDFEVGCAVEQFTITMAKHRSDWIETVNQGSEFNAITKDFVSMAVPGDTYYFDSVMVRCPGDIESRMANSLIFKIE